MKIKKIIISVFLAGFTFHINGIAANKYKKFPYINESPEGEKTLVLTEDLEEFLSVEFPDFKIPKESDFNPDMVSYYNSRLIGIHPAVAWGDFNGDKKTDYALFVVTSESKWGPIVELVVLNGVGGKDVFQPYRLSEIYNFKDDYLSFYQGKLTKGRFKKGAWYINWDKKNNTYVVNKS